MVEPSFLGDGREEARWNQLDGAVGKPVTGLAGFGAFSTFVLEREIEESALPTAALPSAKRPVVRRMQARFSLPMRVSEDEDAKAAQVVGDEYDAIRRQGIR